MKIMGKVIDKMMEENDKESMKEILPALIIKISTNGNPTEEEEEEDSDIKKELKDRFPKYVEKED